MFFISPCAYRAPMVARAVQKILKIYLKTTKKFSRTVSGPQLGRPDELWGNLMRVLKLRSSSTTSTQQRSTICSHRPCILDLCAPRRRHARASTLRTLRTVLLVEKKECKGVPGFWAYSCQGQFSTLRIVSYLKQGAP